MIYKKPILKQAVSDYQKAIVLGYNKGSCYYNLGVSFMYVDDSMALAYLNKSYEFNPNRLVLPELIASCKKRLKEKSSNQK